MISNNLLFNLLVLTFKDINGMKSYELKKSNGYAFYKNEISDSTSTIWNWHAGITSNNKNFRSSSLSLKRCKGGYVCQNEECDFKDITDGVANFARFLDI